MIRTKTTHGNDIDNEDLVKWKLKINNTQVKTCELTIVDISGNRNECFLLISHERRVRNNLGQEFSLIWHENCQQEKNENY